MWPESRTWVPVTAHPEAACLPWLGALRSGRPGLEAQLLCRLSGTPARLCVFTCGMGAALPPAPRPPGPYRTGVRSLVDRSTPI